MKKNVFRVLSLLLVFAMMLTVFASCNKDTDGDETTTIEETTVDTTGDDNTTEEPGSDETTAEPGTADGTATTAAPGEETTAAPVDNPANTNTPPTAAAEILALYTQIMNQAKSTDKPGFTKVEYQLVANTSTDRIIEKGGTITSMALGILEGFFTDESTAKGNPNVVSKGSDMKDLVVTGNTSGCLLTDASFIKSAKCEALANGNWKITIVVNNEANPEPTPADSNAPASKTGSMFSPISRSDIESAIASVPGLTVNMFDLNYHDCTATLEFNSTTKQIVSLEQIMVIGADIDIKLIGINLVGFQNIYNTLQCTSFVY